MCLQLYPTSPATFCGLLNGGWYGTIEHACRSWIGTQAQLSMLGAKISHAAQRQGAAVITGMWQWQEHCIAIKSQFSGSTINPTFPKAIYSTNSHSFPALFPQTQNWPTLLEKWAFWAATYLFYAPAGKFPHPRNLLLNHPAGSNKVCMGGSRLSTTVCCTEAGTYSERWPEMEGG